MDKKKEMHYFKWAIAFVVVSYLIIKVMDSYPLIFTGVGKVMAMLSPFIMAFVIAYMVNPIVMYFENKLGFKRGLSIFGAYLVIILLLALAIFFIAPIFIDSIKELIKDVPTYVTMANDWIMEQDFTFDFITQEKLNEAVDKLIKAVPTFLGAVGGSITTILSTTVAVISKAANFFIAIVVSCFILIEKEKFLSYSKKITYLIFKPKFAPKILEITHVLNANIGKYLVGKFVDSIFVGICAIIGLLLVGSKYAVLLGTVFGIANMIPYFGPIITTAVAVFINLFTSPMKALITLVVLLIIQQIENLILDPKIVGKSLGLSPFFTFLAVSVGGNLFGIPGMILAAPVMAIIKYNVTKNINKEYYKLEKKMNEVKE
ncbi:MAG: AI-2E family transporter [Clostridium sp.]